MSSEIQTSSDDDVWCPQNALVTRFPADWLSSAYFLYTKARGSPAWVRPPRSWSPCWCGDPTPPPTAYPPFICWGIRGLWSPEVMMVKFCSGKLRFPRITQRIKEMPGSSLPGTCWSVIRPQSSASPRRPRVRIVITSSPARKTARFSTGTPWTDGWWRVKGERLRTFYVFWVFFTCFLLVLNFYLVFCLTHVRNNYRNTQELGKNFAK